MHHQMPGFIFWNFGVATLIKALIAVNAVASGTAHSSVVPSTLISFIVKVTSITITQIGKRSKFRICLYIFGRNSRNFFQFGRKLPGKSSCHLLHIIDILLGTESWGFSVGINKRTVGVNMIVVFSTNTEAPRYRLHLARIAIHHGETNIVNVIFVTLPASVFIYL